MSYYEVLAEKIFEHDNSAPDNPIAAWREQPDSVKAPFIRVAQIATIALHPHNEFDVSMRTRPPETVAS